MSPEGIPDSSPATANVSLRCQAHHKMPRGEARFQRFAAWHFVCAARPIVIANHTLAMCRLLRYQRECRIPEGLFGGNRPELWDHFRSSRGCTRIATWFFGMKFHGTGLSRLDSFGIGYLPPRRNTIPAEMRTWFCCTVVSATFSKRVIM